jgi:hypothetical protein
VKNRFQSLPFKRNLQRYTSGPTCLYKLSSLVLSKKIRNHGGAVYKLTHKLETAVVSTIEPMK